MEKRAVVIGLGFAGSVMARELAEAGFSVLAFEKRSHIGGNMYEYERANGVRVHMYGPHIFHTNSKKVYAYLSRFSDFYPYTHRVLGKIDGQLVPIPFNFTSIDALFPEEQARLYRKKLNDAFGEKDRVFVSELIFHPDPDIAALGKFVFDKVFVNYTAKQWGIPASQVDMAVINRVPVVLGTDDRYFADSIQMMPMEGYTHVFEKMLNHPNISILLDANAMDHIQMDRNLQTIFVDGEPVSGPVCYSGPIDELFDFQYGALPYRSADMIFEDYPTDYYQTASVINYPNEEDFTRITEFKHMTLQVIPRHTTILKEYPLPYQPGGKLPPYYPVSSKTNHEKYDTYLQLSRAFPNLYLCGRLAEYRYYNMDAVIDRALHVSKTILENYSAGKKF